MEARKPSSALVTVMAALRNSLAGSTVPGIGEWHWTPKHVGRAAMLLLDPWTQFRVAKAVWRREVRPIVNAAPLMMFKYLTDYVKTGLSRKERASILIHHYNVVGERIPEHVFRSIVDQRLELWQARLGRRSYRIALTFPRETHVEGDLALVFSADDTDLYTMSFTIGPGSVVGLRETNVLYIARVQGKGQALPSIREAARACLAISPRALLLAAADGIAQELSIERIVGVSAGTQLSADRACPTVLIAAYDEFWLAAGGRRLNGELFELSVPVTDKPIEDVKSSHRTRVRRRREFKLRVAESARVRFREAGISDVA